MKFWEATAILTAARWGTPPQDMIHNLPAMEDMTRKALRASGIDKTLIDQEYPPEMLGRALLMIHLDPEEFERYLQAAIDKFVQRN